MRGFIPLTCVEYHYPDPKLRRTSIWLAVRHIEALRPSLAGTQIAMAIAADSDGNSESYEVEESVEQVLSLIEAAR